jgi:hypothetical protein
MSVKLWTKVARSLWLVGAAFVLVSASPRVLGIEQQPGFGGNQLLALSIGIVMIVGGAVAVHPICRHNGDVWSVLVLAGMTAWLCTRVVDMSAPPFEDAAMLMRYADNFRAGHGIVFNPGGPTVDGATDLLLVPMVAIAELITGLGIPAATRFLSIASQLGLVALVYYTFRRLRAPWPTALFAGAFMSVSPGMWLAGAYFCTPVFALSVLLLWLTALGILDSPDSKRKVLGFVFTAAITALIRPEGWALAVLMLLALAAIGPDLNTRRSILAAGVGLALIGVAGVLFRLIYFGYPLPNPYYVRGTHGFDMSGAREAASYVFRWSWPILPLFLLGLGHPDGRRRLVLVLVPALGYTLLWGLYSHEMNFGGRYQYPLLSILVIGAWWASGDQILSLGHIMSRGSSRELLLRRVVGLTYVLALLVYTLTVSAAPRNSDGGWVLGRALARIYGDRGWTMAVTDAGNLPFYSRWRAVDALGLNDKHIAHHGLTPDYLDRFRPALIMVALNRPVLDPRTWMPKNEKQGQSKAEVLRQYALDRGYVLAAVFAAEPANAYWYFVAPEIAKHSDLVSLVRSITYYDRNTDAVSTNVVGTPAQSLFDTPIGP